MTGKMIKKKENKWGMMWKSGAKKKKRKRRESVRGTLEKKNDE